MSDADVDEKLATVQTMGTKEWRLRSVNTILTVVTVLSAWPILYLVLETWRAPVYWWVNSPFFLLYGLLLTLTAVRTIKTPLRAWGLVAVGYGFAATTVFQSGLAGGGLLYFVAIPPVVVILLGVRAGIATAVVSLTSYSVLALLDNWGWLAWWFGTPSSGLFPEDMLLSGIVMSILLVIILLTQIRSYRAQSQALELSHQVAGGLAHDLDQLQTKTADLEHHNHLLRAYTNVSQGMMAMQLVPNNLIERTPELLIKEFGLDRVTIFLGEETGTGLVLGKQSGTENGDRTGATERGGVPPAALRAAELDEAQIRPVTRLDSAGQTVTAFEVAFPMTASGPVIGVLDVRMVRDEPFGSDELTILQTMADHLAIHLDNAQLYSEARTSLQDLDSVYRTYTAQAWRHFVRDRPQPAYHWRDGADLPKHVWKELFRQAQSQGQAITGQDMDSEQYLLAVPLRVREIPIGVLGFCRARGAGPWKSDQISAIEAVGERLALTVDNLRLLEETQRRAAYERKVGEVGGRLRETLDVETVLRTALREFGGVVPGARIALRMGGVDTLLDQAASAQDSGTATTDATYREQV